MIEQSLMIIKDVLNRNGLQLDLIRPQTAAEIMVLKTMFYRCSSIFG
jgi:hypothetical protein